MKRTGNKRLKARSLIRRAKKSEDFGQSMQLLVEARNLFDGESLRRDVKLTKTWNRAYVLVVSKEMPLSLSA
jgi:hypothetical protein